MKRLLILIAALSVAVAVSAQSRYEVYRTGGDVAVKKFRSEEWKAAARHDELVLMDILKIGKDGSMVVLDKRNRSLYRFDKAGEKSLKGMIDDALRKADNVTANLNRELISELKDDKGDGAAYTQVAAAYRGADNSSVLESLGAYIAGIGFHESGDAVPCRFYEHPEAEGGLGCTAVEVSEDEVHFSFTNSSGHDVFVNVVCVGSDGSRNMCFDFGYTSESPFIFLPDGAEVSLPQYSFATADGGFSYVMLATAQIYDYHELQMLCSSIK